MTVQVEQIGEDFGVTVRYKVENCHVIEFFAAEVLAQEIDGTNLYWRKGSDSSIDPTPNMDEAERYVDGSVKWDGCAHYTFGDEHGYLHLCGVEDTEQLADTIKAIHKRCGELMKEQGTKLLEECFDERKEAAL